MKIDGRKIKRSVFLLAFSIAALILVNGGFAFWQMHQVKEDFHDVVNWDLPLVAQLSPLVDHQVEQTLLLEKMEQLSGPHGIMVINTLRENFIQTGEKFEAAVAKLNTFIDPMLSSSTRETHIKMINVKQLLERISEQHFQYQSQILSMIETMKAGYNLDSANRPSALFKLKKTVLNDRERELRRALLNLRDEAQSVTQQSAAAVERHGSWVVQGIVLFTLFAYFLGTLMLFMIHKVMQSRDRAVAEITYFATHDPLTKLINRRYFFVRLDEAIKAAERHQNHLSLCVCDLDHFKTINDSMGHQAGDLVLTGFGEILNSEKRAEDIAGRFGGDEFVICFPNTQAKDTVNLLERVRRSTEKKKFESGEGKSFSVTATFGVADIDPDNPCAEVLLEAADKALYKAKEKGRNRVVCGQNRSPADV